MVVESGNREPLLCYPLGELRGGGEFYEALACVIQAALELEQEPTERASIRSSNVTNL
jgi:hypothetical protein